MGSSPRSLGSRRGGSRRGRGGSALLRPRSGDGAGACPRRFPAGTAPHPCPALAAETPWPGSQTRSRAAGGAGTLRCGILCVAWSHADNGGVKCSVERCSYGILVPEAVSRGISEVLLFSL